jgi:hypothetical protein
LSGLLWICSSGCSVGGCDQQLLVVAPETGVQSRGIYSVKDVC